jgi:hypothetical protein
LSAPGPTAPFSAREYVFRSEASFSEDVALKRVELELSVSRERPTGSEGGTRRSTLTARYRLEPEGSPVEPEEIAAALHRLDSELDEAIRKLAPAVPDLPRAPRVERELNELVETYRPRQPELIDLLLNDGEITEGEHEKLRVHLGGSSSKLRAEPPVAMASVGEQPAVDRPIAAAPLMSAPSGTPPRGVPELLRAFQIENLKQAGAVRARRQISFEEYMSLKRHFAQQQATESSRPPSS